MSRILAIDYGKKRTGVAVTDVLHPKQMNNQESENMRNIVPFVNQLRKKLPDIPVEFVDERFTSVLAHQAMLDGGLKKKDRQNKALVDEISATIILQSYLESKKYI